MLQYLDLYKPGPLEAAIEHYYRKHGIRSPQDIDLEMFVEDAGVLVRYLPRSSKAYEFKGERRLIIVDSRVDRRQQRVELAHELGHVLLHTGTQWRLPIFFRIKEERQADHFAMYALSPTFMVLPMIEEGADCRTLAARLADEFCVPEAFMARRLDLLRAQLEYAPSRSRLQVAEWRTRYDFAVWITIVLSTLGSLAAC